MIKFCHISPTHHLDDFTFLSGAHLLLAHLVEESPTYRSYWKNLDDGKEKILDNSAFEMFQRGEEMMDPSKLIDLGKEVRADYIVMSDYPNEPAIKTMHCARKQTPEFRNAGFKTFFVPQSREGNYKEYIECFLWGHKNADKIGISIIGCPNAFGVLNNPLQRFNSRRWFLQLLMKDSKVSIHEITNLHFLGMLDGPNEIDFVREFHSMIDSWDSSAAIWAGLNGIEFDETPTGLVNGKYEKEVDFDFITYNSNLISSAHKNAMTINKKCSQF